MIAVVMILLLENGLFIARTNPYYMDFLLGLLILTAVVLNRWRTIQSEKKETAVVIGEKV
jgi:ribose transport system permease protein